MLELGLGKRGFERDLDVGGRRVRGVSAEDFDVVVTDLNMRGMSGLELCETHRREPAGRPGHRDHGVRQPRDRGRGDPRRRLRLHHQAVRARRARVALERAVEHRELREEVKRLAQRGRASDARARASIIGRAAAMRSVYDLDRRASPRPTRPVLITGESGTGKELVARALHAAQPRARAGPFVAINCAAMPETLLESELFGHVRARSPTRKRGAPGLFVQANGGTLFLDEIGEHAARHAGEAAARAAGARGAPGRRRRTEIPFDARIIAATNRDLESEVDERRFREDLYYRINVVHIDVPPLRARGGDVLLLAQHFLRAVRARNGKKRRSGISHAGRREAARVRLARQRARAGELHRARGRADALRPAHRRGSAREDPHLPRSHVIVAGDDPTSSFGHGRARAPLHPPRARGRRRQQDARRRASSASIAAALSEARALRHESPKSG